MYTKFAVLFLLALILGACQKNQPVELPSKIRFPKISKLIKSLLLKLFFGHFFKTYQIFKSL